MNKNIMFGADPEFFAYYNIEGKPFALPPVVFRQMGAFYEDNGRHPIFMRHETGSIVHEDGAAFEMSVNPSNDWNDLFDVIDVTRRDFGQRFLSNFDGICESSLLTVPTVGWDVPRWEDEGPEFKLSTLFGCDPDEDLYNMKAKCKVLDASKHPERYGGGHIHVSGVEEIRSAPLMAIRSLVLTVGMASTAFSDVPDLEKSRLFLYGRPGKFRKQTYSSGERGVEYRTPSNTWTKSKEIASHIFHWARIGIENLLIDNLLPEIAGEVEKEAVQAILECDQNKAHQILDYISTKI